LKGAAGAHPDPRRRWACVLDKWTFGYPRGDLMKVTDALNPPRVWNLLVDNAGNQVSLTDPYGERTLISYDQLDGGTQITDARGRVVSYTYDANENLLTASILSTNTTYTFAYNPSNLVRTYTNPLSGITSYTYDGLNNLYKLVDPKSQTDYFCYDGLNHLTFAGYKASGTPSCTSTYESTISYSPDPWGRMTSIADTGGGSTISQSFFKSDQLNTVMGPLGTNSVSYTYDNAGRRQTMTAGSQGQVSYGYLNNNQIHTITQGTRTITYGYDNANRLTSLTLPNSDVQTYTLDADGETTKISYDDGATNLGAISYAYDAVGRPSNLYGSWARLGLPTATTSNATYDANGYELQTWNGTSVGYDSNGNMTSFGSQTFGWNARNQLTSTSGGSASFTYDAFGRRLSKTVSGTTTKYLYDGPNVVEEQNGSGTVTADEMTGLGVDQTYWRNDVTNVAKRNLLTDIQGSTVATTTQANGTAVKDTYTYTPYGLQTNTLSETNPFQYTGREWDGATGLQYNRTRYYNPTIGQFLSVDPVGLVSSSFNPNVFVYGSDGPTYVSDPSGLCHQDCGFLALRCIGCVLRDTFIEPLLYPFGSPWNSPGLGQQTAGIAIGSAAAPMFTAAGQIAAESAFAASDTAILVGLGTSFTVVGAAFLAWGFYLDWQSCSSGT
jgi:RHS repeat-associated protein